MHFLLAAASDDNFAAFGALGISAMLIFGLITLAITMIPYFRIIQKAGYSGWYCLLMLVPLVNIVMLWVFAFSTWPAEERARMASTHLDTLTH